MAGYNFGPKAVFGSGNTTVDLTGPTVVVGVGNIGLLEVHSFVFTVVISLSN